ncbi:MAG: hypothetical protein JST85_13415 [Acidobacteria bacterium]|nr:hypothetical protein [Acidobacteriota bacterium]
MKKRIQILLVLAAMASALTLTLPSREWLVQAKLVHEVSPQSANPPEAQKRYLGVQTCGACHTDIVEKQQQSTMAKAMEKAADCQLLIQNPKLKFQLDKFTFRIERQGDKSIYYIGDGKSELSMPILYGFGQGKAGQTYVYEYNGSFYESRVSFYTDIRALDLTLGYAGEIPKDLVEAGGRRLSVDETRRCFSCHTTGAIARIPDGTRLGVSHLTPGVNCESCHGPGDQHIAALKAGEKAPAKMKRFSDLDGDDIAQTMCGTCHRSVEDVIALPNRGGIGNVRFQPYRIFNSRCYSADKRIGCVACHDPHGKMEESADFYDAKCLACHQSMDAKSVAKPASSGESRDAKACKVATRNCASCHMPKVEVPGAHFKFTDHRIRIVREGAPFPS